MTDEDDKHRFVHAETNTIYRAEYDQTQYGVWVFADTKVSSGKIMRLKTFISVDQIDEADFDETMDVSLDPTAGGLRLGFLKLMPQVKAKLDELGERDMFASDRYADSAIDSAVAKEKADREAKEREALKAETDAYEGSELFGTF